MSMLEMGGEIAKQMSYGINFAGPNSMVNY